MSKKASATLKLALRSEKASEAIKAALEPETKASVTARSRVKIVKEGKNITLFFDASDTTALRASMNSYLNWLRLLKELYNSLNA
ncbi:MAG: KEOPS complex subunit Pcc1 [Candidatus Bathyarchaeia archaeon]|nr:hypothetical protein [Candidatus Bathyarchaeota archaeon]